MGAKRCLNDQYMNVLLDYIQYFVDYCFIHMIHLRIICMYMYVVVYVYIYVLSI